MDTAHLPKLPFSFAKQYGVCVAPEKFQVPDSEALTLVHQASLPANIIAECRRALAQPFVLKQIDETTFTECLTQAYETEASHAQEVMLGMEESMDLDKLIHELPKAQDLLESEDDAPIIKLLNALFTQAIKQNASDIHVETFEQRLIIRFRVDGVLREVLEPPRVLAPLIISRLKVMARLDIAEKRLPQDGRIALRIAGRQVDVRVSTLPSSHGERVVLRLLDKQTAQLDLKHLGLSASMLATLHTLIYKPHGIILVTGPTGSGKTTTLYAALTVLNETRPKE